MATNFIRLHPNVAEQSFVEIRRAVSGSNSAALKQVPHSRPILGRTLRSLFVQSAVTLSWFVLPDGSAALQNGSDVGLPSFYASANCGSVSANWRCCYAVLCASRNSSRCDFVFLDRSGVDRCNLFLEIGSETWLLIIAPLFCYLRLWFNMLDGLVAFAAGRRAVGVKS